MATEGENGVSQPTEEQLTEAEKFKNEANEHFKSKFFNLFEKKNNFNINFR